MPRGPAADRGAGLRHVLARTWPDAGEAVTGQKAADFRDEPGVLLRGEAPMPAARNGQQLVGDAHPLQGLVQPDRVTVRNGGISVSVNGKDRRQAGAHVLEGRDAPGDLLPVWLAPQPLHGIAFLVGALQQI